MSEPLTAEEAKRRSEFSLYRKMARTLISDSTFPPGTVYQTPEGLRAEDEETRCAFDVQGGIYPIRESVFKASYTLDAARSSGDVDAPDFLDGARAEYNECKEVRRLLGYLWTATGKSGDDPVYSLFDADDPIVADVERLAIMPALDGRREEG